MMESNALAPLRRRTTPETYPELLARLSTLSVDKYCDPTTDIAWDDPANAIAEDDPRLALDPAHPFARTRWYAALGTHAQARFGLAWLMQAFKNGIRLEAGLGRGLLDMCSCWPNRSPEYRYMMHELIEEHRHSMMFQELIDRSGVDARPPSALDRVLDDGVIRTARSLPELFFFAVLIGELFIDEQNRRELRRPRQDVHPLVRRVLQAHVTEEARHVCFAERFLHEHLPSLSLPQRERIGWTVPLIAAESSRVMLMPDRSLVRRFAVPQTVMREVFGAETEYRVQLVQTALPITRILARYGMLQPRHARLWRLCGFPLEASGDRALAAA